MTHVNNMNKESKNEQEDAYKEYKEVYWEYRAMRYMMAPLLIRAMSHIHMGGIILSFPLLWDKFQHKVDYSLLLYAWVAFICGIIFTIVELRCALRGCDYGERDMEVKMRKCRNYPTEENTPTDESYCKWFSWSKRVRGLNLFVAVLGIGFLASFIYLTLGGNHEQ